MKYCVLLAFIVPVAYGSNLPEDSSENHQQAKEYCFSMLQDGTPDAEATEFVNQCMLEQSAYFDEVNEALKPDCYQQVDNIIQEKLDIDPSGDYDYDQLLNNCLNGTTIH